MRPGFRAAAWNYELNVRQNRPKLEQKSAPCMHDPTTLGRMLIVVTDLKRSVHGPPTPSALLEDCGRCQEASARNQRRRSEEEDGSKVEVHPGGRARRGRVRQG